VRSFLAIALHFECLTEQAKPAGFEVWSGNGRPLGDVTFVSFLEQKLGRSLRKDRPGPERRSNGPAVRSWLPFDRSAAPGEDGLQFVWRRPKTWESSDLRFRPEKPKVGFRQTYFASLARMVAQTTQPAVRTLATNRRIAA
jgi:hypothetical protein